MMQGIVNSTASTTTKNGGNIQKQYIQRSTKKKTIKHDTVVNTTNIDYLYDGIKANDHHDDVGHSITAISQSKDPYSISPTVGAYINPTTTDEIPLADSILSLIHI